MKQKDLLIINELRKNARETLTNISKRTHIPISTIYEKLKASEGKVIIKHTALINFAKMGFNARAKIMMRGARETRSELRQYLCSHQNVNSMYKINNGYDFMVECIFGDMKELEDFVDLLDEKFGLQKKQVFYVIEDLKRETFLADPDLMPAGFT
jgi:Lrp/AsnC family leucine-responsive transcriptional regulator